MSLSSSSDMNDQIDMTLSSALEQAMSIHTTEEVGSSSAPRSECRRCNVNRDHKVTYLSLHHDYFNDDCVYPYFHQRYYMQRSLFLSTMNKLSETSPYITEKYDVTTCIGLTLLQNYTTALCQLAYDMTANTIDEYLKLGKTTTLECLEYYCAVIVDCYGAEFLHRPTVTDTHRLITSQDRGAYISRYIREHTDYMHWQ
jgi:hypothetical protein